MERTICSPKFVKKIDKLKDQTKKVPIKTWSRNSTIIPEFVGHSFLIHNGKSFIPITISEEMVGHKLGNFHLQENFLVIHLQIKKLLLMVLVIVQLEHLLGAAPKAAPGAHRKQHQEQLRKQHPKRKINERKD